MLKSCEASSCWKFKTKLPIADTGWSMEIYTSACTLIINSFNEKKAIWTIDIKDKLELFSSGGFVQSQELIPTNLFINPA